MLLHGLVIFSLLVNWQPESKKTLIQPQYIKAELVELTAKTKPSPSVSTPVDQRAKREADKKKAQAKREAEKKGEQAKREAELREQRRIEAEKQRRIEQEKTASGTRACAKRGRICRGIGTGASLACGSRR